MSDRAHGRRGRSRRARPGTAPTGLDLRLVWPAAACWLSAGLLVAMPTIAGGVAAVLWAAGLVLILPSFRWGNIRSSRARGLTPGPLASFGARTRLRPVRTTHRTGPLLGTLAVCCAAAALVATTVAVQAPHRLPDTVRAVIDEGARATALVTVSSSPVVRSGAGFGGADQLRFRGSLTRLEEPATAPGQDQEVSVPVVVFTAAAERPPAIGDDLRLTGTLVATEPGDAASALFFGRGEPEPVRPAPWFLDWANRLRAGFAAAAGDLPGAGADLLPGLAIGDTAAVDDDLDSAMKASSLSHLTAVSGANCAIVLALVLAVSSAVGLSRRWRVACALLVLAGFVVLVTPEPSVIRAATMATIVLIAGSVGRPGRGLPALALAVLVLLVSDPWLARNYGFALSVLATLGLLVLTVPLARRLRHWLPAPVAAVLAIPVAAQLACQPVLVLLSPTLPAYGVPANLLAAAAAPVATIVGLAACLLLPWLPVLAAPLVWLAWLPATWIAAVAQTTAALPASSLPWLGGGLGVLLTLACTVAIVVLLAAPRPGPRQAVARLGSGALLCLAVGCTVGASLGTGLGRASVFPADWQIAACDIGQGDAVVVRDGDQIALIDVGPDPTLLTACLADLGIDRVNLLVLTHYDFDHVGGLDAVIGRVDTALVGPPDTGADARLGSLLARSGARVTEAARGQHGALGALAWQVLWPIGGADVFTTGNDGSVTLRFDGRGISSVFLGDLGAEAQDALLAAGGIGQVDVVKVAHHGSGDQSAALYADLRARVGLVSVGEDNGYGHPTRSVLALLDSASTATVRTDQDGLAVIAPAGGALRVWTERVGPAG